MTGWGCLWIRKDESEEEPQASKTEIRYSLASGWAYPAPQLIGIAMRVQSPPGSGGACHLVSTLCSHRRVVGRECLSFGLQEEYTSCMQHLPLPIIIESDQDGYFVTCPALQGCYSQGETYEEAVTNIKDAIRLHIEDRLADGEEIPQAVSVSLSTVEIAV